MIQVTQNIAVIERLLANLERALSPGAAAAALHFTVQQTALRHRTAIAYGGHHAWGGPQWAATDAGWAEKMQKGHTRPMYWTGEFERSIDATVPVGLTAFVQAVDYAGFFQWGPLNGRVPLDADGHVVKDSAQAVRKQKIRRKPREVFWVDESPTGDWMNFERVLTEYAGPGFDYEQF